MKILFFLFAFFFSGLLMAQGNEFQNYLKHFENVSLTNPDELNSRLASDIPMDESLLIPEAYVGQYIIGASLADDSDCRYYYSAKASCGDYVLAFAFREFADFPTRWGNGIRECLMMVYTPNGERKDSRLICRSSNETISRLLILSGASDGEAGAAGSTLCSVAVDETTLLDCVNGSEGIYEGMNYLRSYSVGYDGGIRNEVNWFNKKANVKAKKLLSGSDEMLKCGRYRQYFSVDTARLNHAYRMLVSHPQDAAAEKEFFDAFPDTWEQLQATYQYIPDKEYDLSMFRQAQNHLDVWYGLTSIPDSLYCRKLVGIAVGGRLNGIDVGQEMKFGLKPLLEWAMEEKANPMFAAVSQMRKGHQFEFWEFYWSSILYRNEKDVECRRLSKQFVERYPEEVEIMQTAYKYFHNGVNCVGNGFEDMNEKYWKGVEPKDASKAKYWESRLKQ